MKLLPDFFTGLLLAKRAHFFSTSFWLTVVVLGAALLASQFSGRQPATVALDVGLSAIRLLLPFIIILLAQELLSREFDRRYYLTSVTYPRSRHWLLLGRVTAILFLIGVTLLVMSLALAGVTNLVASGYAQASPINLGTNYWLTIAFIAIDLFVLTTMASLLAVVASTPSFVLIGTLGFMLMARSYSSIIALLEQQQQLFNNTESYRETLSVLNFVLPDLASLDIRMISLYDKLEFLPQDWPVNLTASIAYGLALTAFSLLILQRKRFS